MNKKIFLITGFSLIAFMANAQNKPAAKDADYYTNAMGHADLTTEQGKQDVANALFMIDLYNRGEAGGDTGICVDLDQVGDETKMKVGLDTKEFFTGKSGENDTEISKKRIENLKRLIADLAKKQGSQVDATVIGYADGQHYTNAVDSQGKFILENENDKNGNLINKGSIHNNVDLSTNRAETVRKLFADDQDISFNKSKGFASPNLEKDNRFAGKKDGLDCPNRRKVIMEIEAPKSDLKIDGSGTLVRAPKNMPKTYISALNDQFRKNVQRIKNDKTVDLSGSTSNKAKTVFDQFIKDGTIYETCKKSPLKEITQVYIMKRLDSKIDVDSELKSLFRKNNTDFEVNDTKGSFSGLALGCFKMPESSFSDFDKKDNLDFQKSGPDMITEMKAKGFQGGEVTVGFDPSNLENQPIPGHGAELGKGFWCHACGFGLFFEPDGKGGYTPQYKDRLIRYKNSGSSQDTLFTSLKGLDKTDPFSAGAMLMPRMFVISNCPGCSCKPTDKIRAHDASVTEMNLLDPDSKRSVKMNEEDFKSACVIRPPIMHACNVSPNDNQGADGTTVGPAKVQYQDLAGKWWGAVNPGLVASAMSKGCGKTEGPAEKIRSISCSDPKHKRGLPTDDEYKDCAGAIKDRFAK